MGEMDPTYAVVLKLFRWPPIALIAHYGMHNTRIFACMVQSSVPHFLQKARDNCSFQRFCPGQKFLLKLAPQSATFDPAIVRLLFDNSEESAVSY